MKKIDFDKLHEMIVFNPWGYNGQVWIHYDGENVSFSHQSQSTSPGDNSDVVGMLISPNISDIEEAHFDELGGTYDYDTKIFTADDGEEMTYDEAILASIREGDWSDYYQHLKDKLNEDYY